MRPLLIRFVVALYLIAFSQTLMATSAPASKTSLGLKQFVTVYLSRNEDLASARLELVKAKEDLQIAKDLWQLDLTLTPEISHTDQDFEQTNLQVYERQSEGTLTLNQSTPIGSEISLSINEVFESGDSVTSSVDSQKTLTISQSLLNNGFGKRDKELIRLAEKQLAAQEYSLNATHALICRRAVDLYIDSYIAQENLQTSSSILNSSKSVYQSIRSSYRKSLVDRIQDYSAEADFLNTQALHLSNVLESEKALQNMSVHYYGPENTGEQWRNLQLLAPDQDLSGLSQIKTDVSENLDLHRLQKNIDVAESNLLQIEQSTEDPLTLSLQLGETTGSAQIGAVLDDFSNKFLVASLTYELPIINHSDDANVRKAKYDLEIAKLSYQKRLREITSEKLNRLSEIANFVELIRLSQKRIEIYRKQSTEMKARMFRGRSEVEEYLIVRDKYFNELNQLIRLRNSLHKVRVQLAGLSQQLYKFCQ